MINFSYYTNKDAPEWIKGRKEQEVREADKARNWAIGGTIGKSLIGLRGLMKDMYDKRLYQLNDEGMPVWRKRDDVGFVDSIIPDKGEYEKVPYGVANVGGSNSLLGLTEIAKSGKGGRGLAEAINVAKDTSKASSALSIGGTALSAVGNTYGAGKGVYDMLNAQNSRDSWKGGVGLASNLLGLLGLVTLNPFATALGGAGSLASMFA